MASRVSPARARDELGAHMSVAGGLHRALERGEALRCGAVQIFVRNQLRWSAPPLSSADAARFHLGRKQTGIATVFAHASYLVNLAAPGRIPWRRSVESFADEVERAEALGLDFVVIHPGSHLGSGREAGIRRVAAALDEVVRRTAGYRVRIALENTAGGGDTLGRSVPELASMLRRTRHPERLGLCLDTCHLFAAGIDIRDEAVYETVIQAVKTAVGLRSLLAFHLNDAGAALGSGLDRHQHIGKGHLGLAPFRHLLNDSRVAHVPKVLETPKQPEPLADRRNLAALRRLRVHPARVRG